MIEQSNRRIATIFALLILCTTPALAAYHPALATSSTGIMIPLYSYPGSYWTQVIQAKNAHPSVPIAVIINPNNGPGSSFDQNYASGIQQMQAAGITVLGYTYSHWGARSASSIEADVDTYKSWYHVDGILFDEMANTPGFESYYSGLSSYVHSVGMGMTAGNPGTSTVESYVGTVDVLHIYENPGLPSVSTVDANTFNGAHSKSNFAIIAFSVGGVPSQSTVDAYSNDVAWMYMTDKGLPNPYDTVPPYIGSEVAMLDTGSGGTTTTAPESPTGLTATASSASQISLSWNAPSNNGGSSITGYKIGRSADAGSTWSTVASNTGSTSTTYSDTGLAASTAYTYRVSAINSVGTSSPSSTASATTLASPSDPPSGTTGGSGSTTGGTTGGSGSTTGGTTGGSGSTTGGTTGGSGSTTGGSTPGTIVLNGAQFTSGSVSSSPYQITLANVNAGTGNNRVLVVGVEANNNNVASVTFGGVQLARKVSSFANNDAEFWYLVNPTGTGNVVVTMSGSTSVVVGAYSFSGVDQANPLPTSATNHNTTPGNPTVSITTTNPNSVVLDSPSIYGGVTLGSPTCTQGWDANMPSAVTGASSWSSTTSPGSVTCGWTASGNGDLWDDVAIEVKADPSANTGGTSGTTGGTSGTTGGTSGTGSTSSPLTGNAVSLTVSSDDLGGSQFSGMWVELHASNGTILATGYTPMTFSVTSGVKYVVYAANYQSNTFNHWQDGTTSSSLTVTPSQNTALTAYYSTAGTTATAAPTTVTITVKSVNLSGTAFSGMWTVVKSGGTTAATGYTPFHYTAQSGSTYTVTVSNYQNFVFSHWSDGSTNPTRTITPAQDTTLVAYYNS